MILSILHQPVVQAVLTGALAAGAVDFAAFRSWKTWHDVETYQWKVASFRWFQGAIVGLVTSGVLNAVIGK